MSLGKIEDGIVVPPHPFGIELEGKLVMIELLFVKKSAAELYTAYQLDQYGYNGTYLPCGPFST